MRRQVAIDPGKWHCGVAVFDDRLLVMANTIHIPPGRWRVERLVDTIVEYLGPVMCQESWIFETPQSYPGMHAREDDLESLRETIAGLNDLDRVTRRRSVRPGTWKGNVPKPIHHGRIYKALSTSELERTPPMATSPDTWDAIGLGLYALRRVGRGGASWR